MSEKQLELKSRRDELLGAIQSIESQLSQMNKIDHETGRRLSEKEFHEWRAGAAKARYHLLKELRVVKTEIDALRARDHLERKAREESQMTRIELKLDQLLAHFNLAAEES